MHSCLSESRADCWSAISRRIRSGEFTICPRSFSRWRETSFRSRDMEFRRSLSSIPLPLRSLPSDLISACNLCVQYVVRYTADAYELKKRLQVFDGTNLLQAAISPSTSEISVSSSSVSLASSAVCSFRAASSL